MTTPRHGRGHRPRLLRLLRAGPSNEYYRCDTVFLLLSMISLSYYVIIFRGVSALGHVIEIVYGFKFTDQKNIFKLMATVQLTGSKGYDM